MHGGTDTGSIVSDAVFGEELEELVVEPPIDEIRVLVDQVDDLVLVEQSTDCPLHLIFGHERTVPQSARNMKA
jgi:hypothetical protein